MSRVLVVLASRDRDYALGRMIESCQNTSTQADIAVYVDGDQADDYARVIKRHPDVDWTVGPRIGPVAAMNQLVHAHPGYLAYGASTDDSEFITPGWDQWVIKTSGEFRSGIGLMAPKLPDSKRMDYPWATAKWIEALGWFAWAGCHHLYWDILLELIGEATGTIRYATKEEFAMFHENVQSENYMIKSFTDARNLIPIIAIERPGMIAKIRAAIDAN